MMSMNDMMGRCMDAMGSMMGGGMIGGILPLVLLLVLLVWLAGLAGRLGRRRGAGILGGQEAALTAPFLRGLYP